MDTLSNKAPPTPHPPVFFCIYFENSIFDEIFQKSIGPLPLDFCSGSRMSSRLGFKTTEN